MPFFGCYPWECPLCRIHFFRKNRMDREERIKIVEGRRFASQELSR
jgi:hypothetical protein